MGFRVIADQYSVACTDKYEREAGKNWDLFYKRNADRVRDLQPLRF
jgi:hypothetical protein